MLSFHALPLWDIAASVKAGDRAYSPATVNAPYFSQKVADVKLRCVMKATEDTVT